jgi:DNA polymerase
MIFSPRAKSRRAVHGLRPNSMSLNPKSLSASVPAQALLGREFRVSQQRGQFIESPLAPHVMATIHPSSIRRAPDDETRRAERKRFVEDLKKLANAIW